MSSQSSYVHHEHPHGLGRADVQETDLLFYDERMIQQTTDSYSPGGTTQVKTTTATQPLIQPSVSTTSVLQTGGGHPVENPHTDVGPVPGETITPTSIVKVEADHLVIKGNHRIDKKKAALIGGGLIGTAILLKLIL